MAIPVANIDSLHEDMIHDCQFDYYSKKLATCSSDRSIKIFDVTENIYHCSATLTVHDGPVWQVSWAHPRFGVIIASCSYDGKVVIQREVSAGNWSKIHEHKFPEASVNSIAWAPHEFGLILACGSSDGLVSIFEYKDNAWSESSFQNDNFGCNSVSWAPFNAALSQDNNGNMQYRIATGSCDNKVRVWRRDSNQWKEEQLNASSGHLDWVRDVAWAPNSALPYNMFASCSEDRTVKIWMQKEKTQGDWDARDLAKFEAPVWRLSWSVTGTVLAVSTGDHRVSLWKQSVDESWIEISTLADSE